MTFRTLGGVLHLAGLVSGPCHSFDYSLWVSLIAVSLIVFVCLGFFFVI